ncbi:MAG: M36 family metallopeptidase, partial [Rhodothermales bacterium]|nr:M36 family metallopeptidase [Rhodothermales bacterium]
MTVPHGLGFVWATILWEVVWDLIDVHGFDPDLYDATGTAGNQIAMNIVTEAMKLQPCSPGFVSGRDAIFAADATLYPDASNPGQGLHYSTLWRAFARRGLGLSASEGSTSSNSDNVEAFDTPLAPSALGPTPSALSFALESGETARGQVVVTNTAGADSEDLLYSASVENFVPREPAPVYDTPAVRAVAVPLGTRASEGGRLQPGVRPTDVPLERGPALPASLPTGTALSPRVERAAGAVNCTDGQTLEQLSANFFSSTAAGGQEFGQSFTAPCTGLLDTVSPVINRSGNETVVWDAVLRIYEGAGTSGTELAAGAFSFDNATGPSTAFLLTITLPAPVPVVEGQAYTFFIDMTANATGIQGSTLDPYAGGNLFVTVTGDPADAFAIASDDFQFTTSFLAPGWATLPMADGYAPPGGSSTLDVDVDATGLADGTYTADLVITTNDPGNPSVTIPLELVVAPALDLSAHAILDGAYDSGSGVMRTDLVGAGYLPESQPFADKGYAGSETADAGVFTGSDPPVDWVLLHLRSTPAGADVASRSGLLLGDGSIVDMDGTSPVGFVGTPAGTYHVVVEARNNLSVMSAAPVDLTGGSATFNFSTALTQAYQNGSGSPPMREVDA